jgi:hypothetical protein
MPENENLDGLTPDEKLQADSDLLKLKLQMEFGMKDITKSSKLDDKIQNDFLNYIYNFEKEFAKNKQATVFEILGKPEFKKADTLSDIELDIEFEKLNLLLFEKKLDVNTICEYDNRVIYKFITEELFDLETDDMDVPGMFTNFIYEEFHPNHNHDIIEHISDFVETLITREPADLRDIFLSQNIQYNKKEYAKKDFVKIINEFQKHHGESQLIHFEPIEINFDLENETGTAEFSIKYKSKNTEEIFEGQAMFDIILIYDFWSIASIKIPGFSS